MIVRPYIAAGMNQNLANKHFVTGIKPMCKDVTIIVKKRKQLTKESTEIFTCFVTQRRSMKE